MPCLQDYTKGFRYISDYRWKWLKGHFTMFKKILKEFNLKSTIRCVAIHKQCTNQSKICQIRSFLCEISSKILRIF